MGQPLPETDTSRREQLQTILEELMGETNHVYFQPPSNIQMVYPCIVYKRDYINEKHAGNEIYSRVKRYQIQVISRDPDSEIPEKVSKLPMCSFNRFYIADNLNHDVYTLYF